MNSWTVISRSEHAQSYWRQRQGFAFASEQQVAEVLLAELGALLPNYVMGFLKENGTYRLITLLGLGSERNYYVGLDNKWLCTVIPAALRGYPFTLLGNSGNEDKVLCIDQDYLTEDSNDLPLFQEDGELTPLMAETLDFLNKCDENRKLTQNACNKLAEAGLIEPWPLRLKYGDGDETSPVEGLYRIKESALNSISRTSLASLRASAALPLAYAQLFSMNQLNQLSQRAELINLQKAQVDSKQELSGLFEDEGTLNFDAL